MIQNFFNPKLFLGPKILSGQETFLCQKNFDQKSFVVKIFLGQTKFGLKKFGLKKFLGQRNFGLKKKFRPKNILTKNCLGSKKTQYLTSL